MRPLASDSPTTPPDGRPEEDQPMWRQDFPIDWPQDQYISRRDFSKFMILTSLAFAAGQVYLVVRNAMRAAEGAPPVREIAAVDAVPIGGSVFFTYPDANNPCVLVRISDAAFVAYNQQCTHLMCPVEPQPEQNQLYCPCHHGVFDLTTGNPTAGPPPRPLTRIHLEFRNGHIYASGWEGGLA